MAIQKKKKDTVMYLGREVPREHFRVFVYGDGCQKLVNSYAEYLEAIASKQWFDTPKSKPNKVKANDSDSKRVCE